MILTAYHEEQGDLSKKDGKMDKGQRQKKGITVIGVILFGMVASLVMNLVVILAAVMVWRPAEVVEGGHIEELAGQTYKFDSAFVVADDGRIIAGPENANILLYVKTLASLNQDEKSLMQEAMENGSTVVIPIEASEK